MTVGGELMSGAHAHDDLEARLNVLESDLPAVEVFDGGGTEKYGLRGITGATYENALYQHYLGAKGKGAILLGVNVSDINLSNVSADENINRGLTLCPVVTVRGGHFNRNGAYGFGGIASSGLIEDVELAFNGGDGGKGEKGGMKVARSTGVVFRHIDCHDNRGSAALWLDIRNKNCLFEDCISENNEGPGFHLEIGDGENQILGGRAHRNGSRSTEPKRRYQNANIVIHNDRDAEVAGVDIIVAPDFGAGWIVWNPFRLRKDGTQTKSDRPYVHDNVITFEGSPNTQGLVGFYGRTPENPRAEDNLYRVPIAFADGRYWRLPGNRDVDFAVWQQTFPTERMETY